MIMVGVGVVVGAALGTVYDAYMGTSLTPLLAGSVGGFLGLAGSCVAEDSEARAELLKYEEYLNEKERGLSPHSRRHSQHSQDVNTAGSIATPSIPSNLPKQSATPASGRTGG